MNNGSPNTDALLGRRQWQILIGIAAVCGGTALAGLFISPARAWPAFLLNNFYFLGLSIIGAIFIAIHYLSRAGWPTVLRRVPESMTGYLPVGALLTLLLIFGVHTLYHWSHAEAVEEDAILQAKSGYLNMAGYVVRMVIFLVLWVVLAKLLVRNSLKQDTTGDVGLTRRNFALSAVFAAVFAVTFSFASVDWIMSLEPHWFSTLFPWYVFSSALAAGTALMTLLLVLLKKRGHYAEVNRHHIHDMGKYVFAFSIFWGYLWYSQYMLIWYANIPEETAYYVARAGTGWQVITYALVILNVGVPLFFLLPAGWKQNHTMLIVICSIILFGHWLDLYLMIMPSSMTEGPTVSLFEPAGLLGLGALFLLLFNRALRKSPMLPSKDPYFEESVHHHVS